MLRSSLVTVCLVASAPAWAGEKPVRGPAPAWVVDVAEPARPGKAPEPTSADAPITVLLSDTQLRFERGAVTSYVRTLFRIGNAQGLAAGNISIPWHPDLGDLGIHRLVIRRGDRVIDVLGNEGAVTVVRREPNLESAMLDGVLTANIQPEGLEVGDLVELATSVSVRDPVLADNAESMMSVGGPLPIGRAHVRVSWPAALPIRFAAKGPLAAAKPITKGGDRVLEMTLDDLQPVQPPKLAPTRYQFGRLVEFSDYADWATVGALMAPLYAKAAILPETGSLADEVAKIKAASTDPKARAAAALALVQDRVRYVALSMGSGALVPADVATTWTRRYGDCKAKTVMLLAVLRALGIAAEPVAVNMGAGDAVAERLPAVGAFNHVLVRATIDGQTYWLDGTGTGDTTLERLQVPHHSWGLPLIAKGAALTQMVPPPLARPASEIDVAIDATAGLMVPAPVELTRTLRGDGAIGLNAILSGMTGEQRDRALRDMWKSDYDYIDVDRTEARFDRATGEMRLTARGKARMEWKSGWYQTEGLGLGYRADFARSGTWGKDAPYAVGYPFFHRATQTIKLPPGFPATLEIPKMAIDRTVGGVEYKRSGAIRGRVFRGEATTRALVPEFPASEAPAVEAALRELEKATVYLQVPAGYSPTTGDVAALMEMKPATADAFIQRGNVLLDRGKYDAALSDFSAAIGLEPKNAMALANRGITAVWKKNFESAERDLAAAEAIDPRNVVVPRARALIPQQQGEYEKAVPLWDQAVKADPASDFALRHRASAHRALGNTDAALADIAAAMKLAPQAQDLRLTRYNILRQAKRNEEALKELDAAVAAQPDETYTLVWVANAQGKLGRRAEAMRLFERALAIAPEAYIYLNRYKQREKTDVAGRRADIEAASALEPDMPEALLDKAAFLDEQGDAAGALAIYDKALLADPANGELRLARGLVAFRSKGADAAAADLAAAAAWAKGSAQRLNHLCWEKATAGMALDSAVSDCEAALAIVPGAPAYLDSKGLALLRLGKNDAAITAYSAAIKASPAQSGSLFGRSLARARLGDRAGAATDLAAARAADPEIEKEFAGYGVTS